MLKPDASATSVTSTSRALHLLLLLETLEGYMMLSLNQPLAFCVLPRFPLSVPPSTNYQMCVLLLFVFSCMQAVLPPEPAIAVALDDDSQRIDRRRTCKGGVQSDGSLAKTAAPRHVAVIMDGNRRFGRVKYRDPLKVCSCSQCWPFRVLARSAEVHRQPFWFSSVALQ